jgi:hypothetical protein
MFPHHNEELMENELEKDSGNEEWRRRGGGGG